MKIYKVIALSILGLFMASCVSEEAVKEYNTQIVFSGKIENTKVSSFQLFKQVSSIDWKIVDSVVLDDQNRFKFAFKDSVADYYRMTSRDFDMNIYLSPKDSIHLTFDALDPLKTVKVKGEHGKHETRYLLAKKFFINTYFTDSLYQLPEEDFHKQIKFIRKEFLFALNEANIHKPEFRKQERLAINYLMAKLMLNYPEINTLLKEDQVELSKDFYSFKESVLEEVDNGLQIPEYVDFYTNIVLYDLKKKNDFSKEAFQKVIKRYFKKEENIKEMNRILF